MRIDGLSLDFFRNYVHLDAAFDPNINVIYGDNAQGKTNLLEAVAYLSGVSHRASNPVRICYCKCKYGAVKKLPLF